MPKTTKKCTSCDAKLALSDPDVCETCDTHATPDVDAETRAAERMRMIEAAKAEHAAIKLWKQNGEQGDRPPSPTLDEMNERYIAAGCAPGSSSPKRRSSTTNGVPTRRGADDDAVVAFAVAARAENPAIKRLQILKALRQSGMSCSRERLYPLLDKLDAETGWVEQKGRTTSTPASSPVASTAEVLDALGAALSGDSSALEAIADAADAAQAKADAAAKKSTKRTSKKQQLAVELAREAIAEPHTAAELVDIAATVGVTCRAKDGKQQIIERITAAIDEQLAAAS